MRPTTGDPRDAASEEGTALPPNGRHGRVEHDGARIWYAIYGDGPPVIMLHGGLGHSGNWSRQIPALVEAGFRAVLIDTRGHGRSTLDARAFGYELLTSDVVAVMDSLQLPRVDLVGWSDGAIVSATLAMRHPERAGRVFAFGVNLDLSGLKPIDPSEPAIARMFAEHARDYARLSPTPNEFRALVADVDRMMASEPNYTAGDLAHIRAPVAIVAAESDEFIKREHSEYLARTIPGARLIVLPGVTHFAPQQEPQAFNEALLAFLSDGGAPGSVR